MHTTYIFIFSVVHLYISYLIGVCQQQDNKYDKIFKSFAFFLHPAVLSLDVSSLLTQYSWRVQPGFFRNLQGFKLSRLIYNFQNFKYSTPTHFHSKNLFSFLIFHLFSYLPWFETQPDLFAYHHSKNIFQKRTF